MSKLAACRSGISLKNVELDKRCTSLHLSRCYLTLAELRPYRGKRWCWNWMRHFKSRHRQMRCCCAECWPVDYWFLSRTQERLLFYGRQRRVDNCCDVFPCNIATNSKVRPASTSSSRGMKWQQINMVITSSWWRRVPQISQRYWAFLPVWSQTTDLDQRRTESSPPAGTYRDPRRPGVHGNRGPPGLFLPERRAVNWMSVLHRSPGCGFHHLDERTFCRGSSRRRTDHSAGFLNTRYLRRTYSRKSRVQTYFFT